MRLTVPKIVRNGGFVAVLCVLVAVRSTPSHAGGSLGSVPSNEVRIGLEGPLSGSQNAVGIGMLDGARLAVDKLNARGGLNGKTVSLVAIDDVADPATGVTAAKAAIAKGLSGVVGPYNSGVGIETLPLYLKAGLVPIRLTSSNATDGFGYTLQPMISQIAPVATAAITSWLRARSVAIVYDRTQAYTKSANGAMKSDLIRAGVTITADAAIVPGKKSYASVVTKLDASKPQLIYVVTYYPEAGLIAKAMFDVKSPAKCLADFGAYDNGFVTAAGIPAARNCPIVGVPAPSDFPGAAPLVAAYQKTFHAAPDIWSPYAYDSVMILADAATKAHGFAAKALRSALDGESKWRGWTGQVTFDPKSGDRLPAPVVVDSTDPHGALHVDRPWATASGFTLPSTG